MTPGKPLERDETASMTSSRERILEHLRRGSAAVGIEPPPPSEGEAGWLARQPPMGELAERFIAGHTAVGGKVIEVEDWAALPEAVGPWMGEYQVRSVMTGTLPRLEPLRRHLAGELGIELRTYSESMEAQEAEIFSTDCGITTARGGIAETGTLIVRPSAEEPRLLSLAPSIHLVLLERGNLFPNLLAFVESGEYQADPPTNLLLITGASRTADIEQILTIGVHGPKVFLVALIG